MPDSYNKEVKTNISSKNCGRFLSRMYHSYQWWNKSYACDRWRRGTRKNPEDIYHSEHSTYESFDMQKWLGKNKLKKFLHNTMEPFVLLLFVCLFLLRRHWERESREGKVIQDEAASQVGRLAMSFLTTRLQFFIFKLYCIAATQTPFISRSHESNLLHTQWPCVIGFLVLVLWKLRESGSVFTAGEMWHRTRTGRWSINWTNSAETKTEVYRQWGKTLIIP